MTQAGEARLVFRRRGGGTVLAESYTRAPLHVSAPLVGAAPVGVAALTLLTSGGGLLGTEELRIAITVEHDAAVAIGSVGALRLLPAEHSSRQAIDLHLDPGSTLLYLPEPLIPCRDAGFHQVMHIELPASASAMLGEIVTPGRAHAGERFAYRQIAFHLQVAIDGHPVLGDVLCLEPARDFLRVALGPWTHYAGVLLLGAAATPEALAAVHALRLPSDCLLGASRPCEGVIVVRLLGLQAHALQTVAQAIGRLLWRV